MIVYLSFDLTDHTATFAIDGKRYEYWLTPQQASTVQYLARRVSTGKAYAYAKRWASHCDRIVIPVAPIPVAPSSRKVTA